MKNTTCAVLSSVIILLLQRNSAYAIINPMSAISSIGNEAHGAGNFISNIIDQAGKTAEQAIDAVGRLNKKKDELSQKVNDGKDQLIKKEEALTGKPAAAWQQMSMEQQTQLPPYPQQYVVLGANNSQKTSGGQPWQKNQQQPYSLVNSQQQAPNAQQQGIWQYGVPQNQKQLPSGANGGQRQALNSQQQQTWQYGAPQNQQQLPSGANGQRQAFNSQPQQTWQYGAPQNQQQSPGRTNGQPLQAPNAQRQGTWQSQQQFSKTPQQPIRQQYGGSTW